MFVLNHLPFHSDLFAFAFCGCEGSLDLDQLLYVYGLEQIFHSLQSAVSVLYLGLQLPPTIFKT
jgi:hypothetical protein